MLLGNASKRFALLAVIGLILSFPVEVNAAEVSLVSGLYKAEKTKNDGANGGGSSSVQVGGRYGDKLTARQAWYGEGGLVLKSYDAPEGGEAPDNFTGISIGGGFRYYLTELNKQIIPYIAGAGGYESDKEVSSTMTETTRSGLYYKGLLGLRFDVDHDFFFEIETQLFKSALFETEKTETAGSGANPGTKTETTRNELFVASNASIIDTQVVIGVKF